MLIAPFQAFAGIVREQPVSLSQLIDISSERFTGPRVRADEEPICLPGRCASEFRWNQNHAMACLGDTYLNPH
jgi:hypothetical protein